MSDRVERGSWQKAKEKSLAVYGPLKWVAPGGPTGEPVWDGRRMFFSLLVVTRQLGSLSSHAISTRPPPLPPPYLSSYNKSWLTPQARPLISLSRSNSFCSVSFTSYHYPPSLSLFPLRASKLHLFSLNASPPVHSTIVDGILMLTRSSCR